MKDLPINWHEGLFLRPHHFQAAERHWRQTLHASQRWDFPYHYGLHTFTFSHEALANHQFQVHSLRARMKDGTLVDLGQDQNDRIGLDAAATEVAGAMANLESAFETEAFIRVYLAIPKLKMGRANVAVGDDDDQLRYEGVRATLADEVQGGGEQEVQLRRLNARILLSTEDHTGYEVLPIAQIKRASAKEAQPQLDNDYIPPVLSIAAWPALGRDIVRSIFDVIGQKLDVLATQVVDRGIGFQSQDPGDGDRMAMLSKLNEAHGVLSVMAFAQGVHPLDAYTELCRIVGKLSVFGDDRRIGDIPAYNHENLGPIFMEIRLRIEKLLSAVRAYEYEQRYFEGVGMGMQVSLEPHWFNSDWEWFIGVNMGDLTESECRELLSPGQLDWKMGSSRQVELLFQQRARGLDLVPLNRPIRALPGRGDWIYYEVNRSNRPVFSDVQAMRTLAVRLKDSLIMNQDRLQGERRLVVSAQGKPASLEFALFAVPTRT